MVTRRAVRGLGVLGLVAVAGSAETRCGDSTTTPQAVDVRVVYVSQLPSGCADQASICYPMCVHHNTPAGTQAVVPFWGAELPVRLTQSGEGRYEGTLVAVPVDTKLRLIGRDIGMCCVDACNYRPVLEDLRLNGTKLTHVVHDGLPAGYDSALEFTVTASGSVRN